MAWSALENNHQSGETIAFGWPEIIPLNHGHMNILAYDSFSTV